MNTKATVLRTRRGLAKCTRGDDGLISVGMGEPLLDWRDVPLSEAMDTLILPLTGEPSACSMGNPHCTYFIDDIGKVDVEGRGRQMEINPLFPQKTNVHFVQIINRQKIRLRIWERGGGIPLGSGSCSCGAAVNGIRRGFLDKRVEVECDGGSVVVEWSDGQDVALAGPVAPVFEGIWTERAA